MLTILTGDAIEQLRTLPDESVQCCVTSPPYWGLRDYSTNGQLGLEKTPEEYVAKMVEVFREVRRVLRKDGTLWLNLGDSYAGGGTSAVSNSEHDGGVWKADGFTDGFRNSSKYQGQSRQATNVSGLKPKDLCGIPWRVAFALQADGWWLRSDIIWAKPNPMPESVTDRPTKSHEYLFLLTKSATYFYDAEAIKERASVEPHPAGYTSGESYAIGPMSRNGHSQREGDQSRIWASNGNRNKRSVWTVATAPYPEAHFATYPPDLIKPCIMAGTSAKGCCAKCGSPWERIVEGEQTGDQRWSKNGGLHRADAPGAILSPSSVFRTGSHNVNKTIGWQPTCKCREPWSEALMRGHDVGMINPNNVQPCTVLDPFAGSGTTGEVALELGRKAILIELNPKYVALIRQRCDVTPGLQLA